MSDHKPITMAASQAHDRLPDHVRNDLYAALLSGTGIRNIEDTLNHQMQATGFKATLKAYINHLLRVEGVATFPEIMAKVEAKVLHDTQAAKNKDPANGLNGVNGHSSESDDYNLALPTSVTKEGAKAVLKELDKVCDITTEDKNDARKDSAVASPAVVAPPQAHSLQRPNTDAGSGHAGLVTHTPRKETSSSSKKPKKRGGSNSNRAPAHGIKRKATSGMKK